MTPLDIILTWVPMLGPGAGLAAARSRRCSRRSSGAGEAESAAPAPAPAASTRSNRSASKARPSPTATTATTAASRSGPLDLTLRRGEIVVLAGGNGSGKTTLVKLLAGLYRPESGVVRIDGRAVADADGEAHRQLFSVVFADGHLFPTCSASPADPIDEPARDGLERLGCRSLVSRRATASSRRSTSRRARGGGWPCSPPGWRTGPSASSTNGPPTRTRRSSRSSTPSCSPRCGPRARACW